ncbi:MAG TPA: amidohydrolase family protein, partial [Candidatus Blautia intestinipullorum]|nr:amidohydrolase family protein [Candidatus Blautia intestinipullorum]
MNTSNTFALKGNICYSLDQTHLAVMERSYLVCEDGLCAGVYQELPERFQEIPCSDTGDSLIIPGLTDLHLHAPQYSFRGMNMDLELLDWLNTVTFPEEARYADLDYAKRAYRIFAEDLKKSPTTRACIFGTLHVEATELLMDLIEETGVKAYIGKVNMDRNGPGSLQEESAEASAKATLRWLSETSGKYRNVKPILTPRFIPSCSDELMRELSSIQKTFHLPLQSHLSENPGETAWVQELCPDSAFYGDAYDRFGLFGGENCPTIMAHCVYSSEQEIALMKKRGVYVAHCPQS